MVAYKDLVIAFLGNDLISHFQNKQMKAPWATKIPAEFIRKP